MFGMFGRARHRPALLARGDGLGRVVTVWGPTGSPGRSMVAAALAGALAPAGRVVLVDADQGRGALGPLLGVTGGGTVVSAATMPAPPGHPCRPRDLREHPAGFWLIRGVPGLPQRDPLDPGDLAALLDRLRVSFDLVLVDVGAALPPREGGAVHLAALRAAAVALVVGALSPVGLSDLLLQTPALVEQLEPHGVMERLESTSHGHPDWQGCRPEATASADTRMPSVRPALWCVLNKGRGRLLQHGPRRVVAETGLPVAATVPLDTRNVGAAEDARLPLTVARPRSPAATILTSVAGRLVVALADMGAPGDAARGVAEAIM